MPFDWRAAAQVLTGGSQNISNMLLQNYARRKDEELWGRQEAVRNQYKVEEEERAFENRQKEIKLMTEQNKELAQFSANLEAEYTAFDKDPYWMGLAKRAQAPEGTDEDRVNVGLIQSIRQRQSMYLPLEKPQLDFIQSLHGKYPTIAMSLYSQESKNQAFLKNLEMEKARTEAYVKLSGKRGEELEGTGEQKKTKVLDEIDKDILTLQNMVSKIKQNKDYQRWKTALASGAIKDKEQQGTLTRRVGAFDEEITNIENRIKDLETQKGGLGGTPAQAGKEYAVTDRPMIIEQNIIGALMRITKGENIGLFKYLGNKKWEKVE